MLEKIARYSLAWAFILACAYCYGWLFYISLDRFVWRAWF